MNDTEIVHVSRQGREREGERRAEEGPAEWLGHRLPR